MLDLRVSSKIGKIRELLEESSKSLIFFDVDCDGIMSYFQLKERFPNLVGIPFPKDDEVVLARVSELNLDEFDLVLFFDTPVVSDEVFFKLKDKKVVWVDHHIGNSKEIIKEYNILHLNPLDYDELDSRPSCFWAYLIADLKTNLQRVVFGSISDFYLLDLIVDLYEFEKDKFDEILKISDEKRDEIFDFIRNNEFKDLNVVDKRSEYIKFLTYDCGLINFKNLFDFLPKLGELEEVEKAVKIIEKLSFFDLRVEISSGKGFLFEDFEGFSSKLRVLMKKALSDCKEDYLVFSKVAKTSYSRQISEEVMYRKNLKASMVCFKKPGKDFYSCSLRGNGFDVKNFLDGSLNDLEGGGGGHQFSVGCAVHKKDFDVFKRRFVENFED